MIEANSSRYPRMVSQRRASRLLLIYASIGLVEKALMSI
jgi:hypothetical protein